MKRLFPAASILLLGLALIAMAGGVACTIHPANTNPLASLPSEQPDKALYDRAMSDIDHGRYDVARLTLETLINAYPDSEYLARAKMAIADAWYRQGGTDGLTQAEAQYKDFITFFPTMNEASEAQLKVATIHFKQIEKADRDPTEAEDAQTELWTFLQNYPQSPLRPQALQMLRDTQEVLAEREDRIGRFYLQRDDWRAAQRRLEDVVAHYPLYSRGDAVMDALATSYLATSQHYRDGVTIEASVIAKAQALIASPHPTQEMIAGALGPAAAQQLAGNPNGVPLAKTAAAVLIAKQTRMREFYVQDGAKDRATAIADYQRIVTRYPLSPFAADARTQLAALHAPIPTPTPEAIAFNRSEIEGRGEYSHFDSVSGMLHASPREELARSDKVGAPSLSASEDANNSMPFGNAETAFTDPPNGMSAGGVNMTPDPTPTAVYSSNANDVQAQNTNTTSDMASKPTNDTTVLTPNQIDQQEQEQIDAEDAEDNPPILNAKAAAEVAAEENPNPNAKPKKKSFFSSIWPLD